MRVFRRDRLRRQEQVLVELAKSRAAERGDLAAALRELTEAAAETLEVERVGVWIYTEDRFRIRCIELFERTPGRHAAGAELAAADFPAYFKALEQERTLAASDARRDERTREFTTSYLEPLGIGAMLDAPLRAHGRMIGMICHEHVGGERRWSAGEQAFAGSIADLAALALEAEERNRAERELRERVAELQILMSILQESEERSRLANEAKDHFLATLSHELRTPLTPVLAMASMLERDERLPGDARNALTMMRRNVELEARLIDDLLDLTRISRGKLELERGAADVRQILEHALDTVEAELMTKRLRLVTDLE
ncbi:MAG TPA: GAF domain-containing sensor histidine kinase, partial [Thermoanaerobaculia bacterium]|nr:GAF domain-containing sensor histidine kinase [Thermoanaerobaculia bacterium]